MKPINSTNMKRLSLFFMLSGVLLFTQSCNEDPEPKHVLLSLNIEPGYFSDEYDIWMFISDNNGRTIDVRQATDSTQINLTGTPRSTMTLTIFRRIAVISSGDGSTWNSFGFETYQEIPAGSTIDLKKGTHNNLQIPDVMGSIPFSLQNYDDAEIPEHSLWITDGIALPYSILDYSSNVYAGNTFSSKLYLRKSPSRILLSTYHNNLPVHLWLDDVKTGDAITVSFDSFVPSKIIPINKQVAVASVKTMTGRNYATGYKFSDLYTWQVSKSSDLSQLPKLGYLDGFGKYFVFAALNLPHESTNIYYAKAGSVPQSINIPDYTYSIDNDNLYGLSLTFSNEYSYKNAYFSQHNSETQVNWNMSAGNVENFKTPSIPSQIGELYPMLNVDGLKLHFAGYTQCLDGYTYADYISDILGSRRRDVYEELSYTISP